MGAIQTTLTESFDSASKLEAQMEKENAPFELLDKINKIEDLESDKGKARHARLFAQLKAVNGGDEEDASSGSIRMKLQLPWEECRGGQDNQNIFKDFVLELCKKTNLLQREEDELEYDFKFD